MQPGPCVKILFEAIYSLYYLRRESDLFCRWNVKVTYFESGIKKLNKQTQTSLLFSPLFIIVIFFLEFVSGIVS